MNGLKMQESVGNHLGRGRASTVAMIVGLFAVAILAWAAVGWAVYELISLT